MPLRLAIIGLGIIGRIHLRHASTLPGVQAVAVADQRPFFEPGLFYSPDWRAVVTRDDVDAVAICLPHALHRECAEAALEAGKHVFLEKPLATTLADAQHLVRRAQAADRTLMVNMTHRFYPPVRRARELLREGAIGNVISVRDYYMETIDRADFPGWFFDPVQAGGGVVMTDAIHLLDRVAWLLGEPLRFVGGAGRRLEPESAVEDCAEILCTSRSGVPVTVGSFFCSGPKSWADGLTLFGTLGSLRVEAWSHLEWCRYGEPPRREEGYPADLPQRERPVLGHRAALAEFVAAVREGRAPEASGADVLNAQEMVEAFYEHTAP